MTLSVGSHIRIVLVGTTHPGNIGAAARAMKTMDLRNLCLVAPGRYPSADATARAAGADDILENARLCDTLAEAVSDCALVYGTSARGRSISLPVVDPGEAAEESFRCADAAGEAAFVFGRESSGLSNTELELCNRLLFIPSNPGFSSLNLAAAVQVIGYELYVRLHSRDRPARSGEDEKPVSAEEMRMFYDHLERSLIDVGFLDPLKPRLLMRRMRRLFSRIDLDRNEYNILRGILTAIQEKVRTRQ